MPRLGLTAPQLDAIMNRADTETAHDAFFQLKASKEMEEANPGLPVGEVKRKASTTASGSKRRRDAATTGEHETDHDLQSNSTPGGPSAGKRLKDDERLGSDNSAAAVVEASSSSAPQQQPPNNYDFFFPDLEAMANGRYPPPMTGSPYNPYAQQALPFFNGPGMGGWAVTGMPDQSPNNQGYGGMGMGMGMPMGYGANGQNQANFSGFGVTMPGVNAGLGPAPGQGNLFTGPDRQSDPSPSRPPSSNNASQAGPSRAGGGGGGEPKSSQGQSLKEAIARLTEGDRRILEGNPMTPAEMAERLKVQEKLMKSLPEGDQNNRMLEAMQVGPRVFNERASMLTTLR